LHLYVLAVVKANSGINSVESLKGKKSCHPHVKSQVGFYYPAYVLKQKGLITPVDCNYAEAVSKFFSESCVPGANIPQGKYPQNLCSLCVGREGDIDPSLKCSASSSEAYHGYTGALRCLTQGNGDVAFVKQGIVQEIISPKFNESWAKDVKYENFQLLCKDGSVRPISEYWNCNWGKINGNKVVTSKDKSFTEVLNFRELFLSLSDHFKNSKSTSFVIFGSVNGEGKNLLFTDATSSLSNVEAISEDYVNMLNDVVNCKKGVEQLSRQSGLSMESCAQYFMEQAKAQKIKTDSVIRMEGK